MPRGRWMSWSRRRAARGTGTGLYTYGTVPIVTAINPATGPIAGGQSVTITGQNFTGATPSPSVAPTGRFLRL